MGQEHRQRPEPAEGDKMVVTMLVTALPGGVIVEPGENHRATRAATHRRAEGMCETRPLHREPVERRGSNHRIAVAPRIIGALVARSHTLHGPVEKGR